MAKTERKQVKKAGDKINTLASVTNAPTPVLPNGSLHGLVKDLTITGVGHDT